MWVLVLLLSLLSRGLGRRRVVMVVRSPLWVLVIFNMLLLGVGLGMLVGTLVGMLLTEVLGLTRSLIRTRLLGVVRLGLLLALAIVLLCNRLLKLAPTFRLTLLSLSNNARKSALLPGLLGLVSVLVNLRKLVGIGVLLKLSIGLGLTLCSLVSGGKLLRPPRPKRLRKFPAAVNTVGPFGMLWQLMT